MIADNLLYAKEYFRSTDKDDIIMKLAQLQYTEAWDELYELGIKFERKEAKFWEYMAKAAKDLREL